VVLVSEVSKDFIRIFLEEYFAAMGVKAETKENLTELRVTVKPASPKYNCPINVKFSLQLLRIS